MSSEPESESLSAAAILAELEPFPLWDEDFDALLEDLPEDLPDDLPEDELDEVFDANAFSSCSRLSVWHSEMSLLRSRLGARWSDVDVTKSLKAGTGEQRVCREQRSYCMTGTTLGQVHT